MNRLGKNAKAVFTAIYNGHRDNESIVAATGLTPEKVTGVLKYHRQEGRLQRTGTSRLTYRYSFAPGYLFNPAVVVLPPDPYRVLSNEGVCREWPGTDWCNPAHHDRAAEVCGTCPVVEVCRATAEQRKESGTWGGLWFLFGKQVPAQTREKVAS